MLSEVKLACLCCWFSLACSLILSLVYWRLGYRFRLLTFLCISLALQHSQKLYLLTYRALFPNVVFGPNPIGSAIVLVNAFAVASYNLSLIAICLHIWCLIQAAGTGYDHIKAQMNFIHGIASLSFLQLLHVAIYNRKVLTAISVLPFLWGQHAILLLQVTLCPVLIIHLLVKCYRARERTFEFLRKSSISRSLMYRLLLALISVVVGSGASLFIQITSSFKCGTAGTMYAPFHLYRATGPQLAARYTVGCIVGPLVTLVFLTAQEPMDYVRERCYAVIDKLPFQHYRQRRKSSIPWLDIESGAVDTSALASRYIGRDSLDTQMRCVGGSRITASSLDPKDSARIDSVDLELAIGQSGMRRMSDAPRSVVPTQPTVISRSASTAAETKGKRSDSLPYITITKDSL